MNRQKILIVDDSELNREMLKAILGEEYDYAEAEDGAQAILMLQQDMNIDLLLLDINMPKIDGFGVLERLNQFRWIEELPVIMISATEDRAVIERCYSLGITDYIRRPFDSFIVQRRVKNTLTLYANQKRLMGMVSDQIYQNEKDSHVMIGILSHIVEFRNSESAQHVLQVQTVTEMLLRKLTEKTDVYGLTEEKTEGFVNMLSEIGHESPIEHVSFTFAIEGVSRSLLAQITRHRIASFSVQSQRYVREKGFEYVVPPEIDKIPAARAKFIQAMEDDQRTYEELTAVLMEGYLKELLEQGVPEKTARSKAEKHAIEDARYVLPNACATRIVMTANARSLKNFFRLRCCNRAQWEIRALAEEMYKQVYAVAPTLFGHCGPACVDGVCTEGKMSCGKAAEVRAHYQTLREGK